MSGLEADPSRDAAYRRRAKGLAAHLLDIIPQALTNPAVLGHIARTGTAQAKINLRWRDVGVEDQERETLGLPPTLDFGLFLAPYEEPHAAFALNTRTGERHILLNLLPNDAQAAASYALGRRMLKDFIGKMLYEYRSSIVHEIIHMFDNMRGDKKIREPVYARATSDEDYRVLYFNNADEFNAFFQQIITEVVDLLNDMDSAYRVFTLRSFDRFLELVDEQHFTRALRRSHLPKWQKKFDARLYQTWEYLRDQQQQKVGLQ